MPSEIKMLEKLQGKKIPIQFIKANTKRLQPVSGLLAALLVKYDNLQPLAQRAFITYLRSIHVQRDKEVFDVMNLPIDEFSASLGLPMTPRIRFLKQKLKSKTVSEESSLQPEISAKENLLQLPRERSLTGKFEEDGVDKDLLLTKETSHGGEEKATEIGDVSATRVLKKKKLKINVHRPVGTRVVFDEEGNTLPPLATLADTKSGNSSVQLDKDKVNKRYAEMREEMKQRDKEDKLIDRQRRKENQMKKKMKWKRGRKEEEDLSGSDGEASGDRVNKRSKIYFNSDSDDGERKMEKDKTGISADSISLAEQEELALKLLSSMHS
uniref:Putative DEAD-box ATP-dependent RNA helicase 32 n=1 Tax=Davidia involucrata TaxID=16924 RepID=A0A5B7AWM7_DAVIN